VIIKTPFAIALFTLGLTKTKYTDMLGYVLELWQRFASPKTLDSMLDFFDVLVLSPCPSLETRSQLLFALSELLWRFSRRIDQAQWRIFRSIVKDLKLEESLADLLGEAVISIGQNLADESKIFQKLTGNGGNDRLSQWVRNSGLVLMATASAKHAATGFIEANRPQHLSPILFMNSKGNASMLREIRKYLES
jgi:hypothetical protein